MGPSEELIPLPLYKDMLDESISSDAESTLSLSISSEGSSLHGSEEELDTDDPFQKFINELKCPQQEKESKEDSELVDEGGDEERKNEDGEFAYDDDDDKKQDFLV